jgi:hypothetical protein
MRSPHSLYEVDGRWLGLLRHALLGAIAGMVLLHPVTKAIYGSEWRSVGSLTARLALAFTPQMIPMTIAFALIGAILGVVFGGYHRLVVKHQRALGFLQAELGRTVASLVAAGETEQVEFKASARWDSERGCVNRELEDAIVRTIAGFLNHVGGSLLIGVADDKTLCGLAEDFRTLRDHDRDGFERFIVGLVRTRLGGDTCPLVHVTFHSIDGRDISRVIVEPGHRPVFMEDRGTSRFMVRTGNSTRELDVREALAHIAGRRPAG